MPYKLLKILKGFITEEVHQQTGEECQEDCRPKFRIKVDIPIEDPITPNKDSTIHNLSRKTILNKDSRTIETE